jgi:hypothetical protein
LFGSKAIGFSRSRLLKAYASTLKKPARLCGYKPAGSRSHTKSDDQLDDSESPGDGSLPYPSAGGGLVIEFWLALRTSSTQVSAMFAVDESTADAIRQAYEEAGELAAVVELRRRFPGIADNENARRCVRANASWTPRLVQPSGTAR